MRNHENDKFDSGRTHPEIYKNKECVLLLSTRQLVNITRYLETLRISSAKSFKIKIAGENLPLSSRLRENTLRYRIFDPGGHMIRSEHMKSCLTAQIRFMLFKGPGSFNKNFKIGGNVDELKACRLRSLTPPLFFHFTLPLRDISFVMRLVICQLKRFMF